MQIVSTDFAVIKKLKKEHISKYFAAILLNVASDLKGLVNDFSTHLVLLLSSTCIWMVFG